MLHKRTALIAALALLPVAVAPAASAHTRAGGYQQIATNAPRDWQTPYQLKAGIPVVEYPWGIGQQQNPVTTAQYGLANWSLWWRYRDQKRLVAAKRAADWLVYTQRSTGKWTYKFPWPAAGQYAWLKAGWSSALAQGQALSLLGRAYRRWRNPMYLRAIRRGLRPLTRHVKDGGLARWHNGGLYFEEYPTEQPNFVMNGMAQTLLGLYDVADLEPRAQQLFDRGVRTLARSMHEFDAGTYSIYSLASPNPCPPGYNPLIRDQLRALSKITGQRVFAMYAERWSAP